MIVELVLAMGSRKEAKALVDKYAGEFRSTVEQLPWKNKKIVAEPEVRNSDLKKLLNMVCEAADHHASTSFR